MVQNLVIFEVFFTHDSKVKDLVCGASSGSESSLLFGNKDALLVMNRLNKTDFFIFIFLMWSLL